MSRPSRLINPLELLTYWEGRGHQRPLSLREIASRLDLSESTVRVRLRALRAAGIIGHIEDDTRARALEHRGGLRRGGRPARPIEPEALEAVWHTNPSPAAIARALGVARPRVIARLRELGYIVTAVEVEERNP
jgi:DNA-binding Lrp family transcriptional regulator